MDWSHQQLESKRLEEALWVVEARAGSAEAFGALLARYEKPIFYFLRRIVGEQSRNVKRSLFFICRISRWKKSHPFWSVPSEPSNRAFTTRVSRCAH